MQVGDYIAVYFPLIFRIKPNHNIESDYFFSVLQIEAMNLLHMLMRQRYRLNLLSLAPITSLSCVCTE